jgi:predicted Fe-Mo cluster-binding NifX family protein
MPSHNLTICFTSTGKGLDSPIDDRFGRCEYFIVVKINNNQIISTQSIRNPGAIQSHGAGMSAAQQVGELGADIVITANGEVGPKAKYILNQLGIEVKSATAHSVQEELKKYTNKN